MTVRNRFFALLLIYCFIASLAPHPRAAVAAVPAESTQPSAIERAYGFVSSLFFASAPDDEEDADQGEGLRFRLSEAPEQAESRSASKVAFASTLSDAETESILKRLPPTKTDPTDEASFALRERSLPAPRTGQTMAQVFPPPISITPPEEKNAGPLEVVRFSPEGDVPIAPNLSITFSQPMVAVSSQEEAAQNVPVKISPEPKGHWRWIGTKTLLFEPDIRFPMSTRYAVSVPAGTRSANGGSLAKNKTWNFTTPPPAVKNFYPVTGSVQRRDTLMFAEFDQRIDPAVMLRSLKVEAGKTQAALRLATPEEIEKDKTVSQLARNAQRDRWLAFRAVGTDGATENALPAGSDIKVSVLPGAASAEGPNTTAQTQAFPFVTFGPLRITNRACGYDKRCRPSDSWVINFTNPIDTAVFDESKVKIEPAITGLVTSSYSSVLYVRGNFKARTTYRLTLDRSIKDVFGQSLVGDNTTQFEVGAADTQLFNPNGNLVVLDPFGPSQYSVYSVNHPSLKVGLYSVGPEDWAKWIDYLGNRRGAESNGVPPGRLVFSRTVPVESKPDEMVETAIDLREALTDDLGQMILVVEPTIKSAAPYNRYRREAVEIWIQRTQIGLDAFVDSTGLTGWANSLRDGAPLAGVELTLSPGGSTGTSGADGTARISLPTQSVRLPANWLVARRGKDVAILPDRSGGEWYRREIGDNLRWYVFDDRGLYRPGEEVHVKGWIRRVGGAKGGDVGLMNNAANSVAYTLKDSRGNEVTKGNLAVNALGGFDFALKLPPTMNLGFANITLRATGGSGITDGLDFNHNFRVEEFRRPEFEVNAKTETEGPFFVGQRAETSVAASYFAGGGLPDAPVVWRVTSTSTNFTPPNRSDFTFGKWTPWWIYRYDTGESHTETFNGRTDASGKHRLRIDFDSVKPARPSTVTAQASVTDVNRQTWTSTATLLVHPADLYVGLKSDKTFVQQGEPLVVQTIVTDLDGKAVANHEVKMQAALLQWKQIKGQWQEVEARAQECSVQSGADTVKCTFSSKEGGTYRVKATIHDDRGRANESEFTLWVAGGKQPPKRGVEAEKVELIPDRKEYQAGDTAQILVQTPFAPAEAVMTLRRSGIVKTERFRIDGSTYTLRIPIDEAWTPNMHVQVDLVGAEDRDPGSADVPSAASPGSVRAGAPKADGTSALPAKRPAFASGELNLSIPPLTRKLSVVATPHDKALEPGGNTTIDVEAKDAGGKPVNGGDLVVVVVDESVLALTGYKLADPIATFYAQRSEDTSDHHSRQALVLASAVTSEKGRQMAGFALNGGDQNFAFASGAGNSLPMQARRVSGGVLSPPPPPKPTPGPGGEPIRLREDFNALAVFAPSVRTDANGHAQVQVKLPDNLTRYRVMAVAVAGGRQFGSGEAAITARLPLMARPSAPRFLNFGDRFELPIVLQNQTDAAMTVEIAVRATNASLVQSPTSNVQSQTNQTDVGRANLDLGQSIAGRRVTVPANDRVEVRIPAAAVKAGTARFQIAAVSGRWSDAAEVQLPVWTPATTEAFATYGEIDSGAISQPVKAPANVFPQFGGLEIETSSTQLQALTDAMIYLTSYPYECSEQLSSRIISIAALRDVLTAFKAKDLPSATEMEAAVTRDLKRLQGMQNPDGGFGFWRRGNESWPYLGIHVAHALARAKQKQFDVPAEMFEKSRKYLREIESHIPSSYSNDTRWAIIAYSLYVRAQMGDRDTARARKLIVEAGLDKLSLESVGWLLSVLSGDKNSVNEVAAIRHLLGNRVTETAGMAHFICSYSDSDYLILNSDRRADGVILEALIGDQPNSDLIPKIVRGLLAHRTRGRWENTQENVFILLALDRYFNAFEKVTPDFVARAWLGQSFAGEQQFRGRSTDRQQIAVPMSYLANQGGAQNLVLAKEGSGRLYYRIGMNYAPSDLILKPADYGFTVERSYEAVDDPQDVARDADGGWRIKAGARVRVRLTMVATSRRYHVALTDPMPAGFEALNPSLPTTGSIPRDDKQTSPGGIRPFGYGWWWWRPEWYEHQNLRDERAEAFTSLLWGGVYKYSYVARATTPGEFVVPPSKAEEMYHPETFGRGKTDRVRIQ